MSVYVDDAQHVFRGMKMSHLIADSEVELHAFAERLGLRREWFQDHRTPHYDISASVRLRARSLGALLVSQREMVKIVRRIRATEPVSETPDAG